ncbi:MAG: OmpA family protein [Desulfobacterales bacterium]|jgi:outer membrane protein OmpA-like peptidoglycan-associated protein
MAIKKNHFFIRLISYCLLSLWAVMSLSGCNQTSKNFPLSSALTSGSVTLLWKEIPGATSYNVYVSKSPGITKLSGSKISNATNPIKIDQLKPGKTYYFAVTVVDEQGESEKSKELSYTAVANKIGLIYWKDLFDKSTQDHESGIAETRQEIRATLERTKTEAERPPLENEALSEKMAGDQKASDDLTKENLQPAKERVAEPVNIEEDLTENSKLALEKMRLRAAQMLVDSVFFIFFEQNTNELSPKAIEKLDQIFEILTNNPATKLKLNGYSDNSGTPPFNQMVSEIRANSVKSYLSGKGITSSRMMAFGHGAQKFIASNKSEEGRRLNRRVEIELIIP